MEFEYSPHGDVDDYRARWLDADEDFSDDEVLERMQNDDLYFQEQFDTLVSILTDALGGLSTADNLYYVTGQNIGWQNKSGERILQFTDGRDVIDRLAPNSEWSMTVKTSGEAVHITVSHHDSPTGEPYTIVGVDADTASVYQRAGEAAALESL